MNYAELRQAVQDYLETDEATFVANFPNFVRTIENIVYTSVEYPAMRRNVEGTMEVGNKYLTVPDKFLSIFSLAIVDPDTGAYTYPLYKDVNLIRAVYPNPAQRGTPKVFGLFDEFSFIFGPTPDKAYGVELHYFAFPDSIVDTEDGKSWLLTNFPSVLQYGVIAEGYRFQKGDAAQQKIYDDQFMLAMTQLKGHSDVRVRNDAYSTKITKPTKHVGE